MGLSLTSKLSPTHQRCLQEWKLAIAPLFVIAYGESINPQYGDGYFAQSVRSQMIERFGAPVVQDLTKIFDVWCSQQKGHIE